MTDDLEITYTRQGPGQPEYGPALFARAAVGGRIVKVGALSAPGFTEAYLKEKLAHHLRLFVRDLRRETQ